MNSQLSDKSIKTFLRNPIGLLGLLAFLFDSVIGLVLTIGLDKLQGDSERQPLIWFLVLYPIGVLILFGYLAIFRPGNLYSPQDYGDGESFIKATSKQTLELRKKEAEEMIREDEFNKDTNNSSISEENDAVIKNHHKDNKTESKEEQKQSLIKRISNAESIGLTAAEKALGLRLIPNVMFSNDGRREIEIDGFNQENGIFTIVEIKYTGNHNWRPTVKRGIETLTNYVEYMKKDGRIIRPLLVVVTSFYEEETKIKQFCNAINDNIDCIVVKDS